MNTKAQLSLRAALCAALFATCSEASARPPRAQVESGTIETIQQNGRTLRVQCCIGTIETIDRDARILRIKPRGEAAPLTLVWNSRTHFVKGTRIVTAAELTKGASVTVWYHTPLFGKRFATKIVIERGPVRPKR
ncbi:MAG: hypothetical protein ABMA13_19805 [Chthoniobacteraceae bacterium]